MKAGRSQAGVAQNALGCFTTTGWPDGGPLDEVARNFKIQLDEEFVSHDCAEHHRGRRSIALVLGGSNVASDEDLSYNKGYRQALESVAGILHLASAENPEAGVVVNRIVQLLVENATANVKTNVQYMETALAKLEEQAAKKQK